MPTASITTTTAAISDHQRDYEETLSTVRESAHSLGASAKFVFQTDASGLWQAFLAALPPEQRQHHTCTACRHFVERFGSLVVVNDQGIATSLMWSMGGHGIYDAPIRAMLRLVTRAEITGVHFTAERTWGLPETGPWHHFAVSADVLFPHLVSPHATPKTPGQRAAMVRHEHGLLAAALAQYPADLVVRATAVLETGKVYRGEVCMGVAKWLLGLHAQRASTKNARLRDNLLWLAAASAPAGWCHVRSGMIGTLLDDLAAGLEFGDVADRFAAKMHPLQYMRPTAAPTAGNVAQAEKIVDALGIRPSLDRRFARLEDVTAALWKPSAATKPAATGGTFGHLLEPTGSDARDVGASAVTMTWEKFARTVLPTAERIELLAPEHGNYIALITSVHPDAPPILQWDRPEQRCPVSWYLYNGGSPARRWNVRAGWTNVTAICMSPPHWHGTARDKDGHRVFVLLEGARDTFHTEGGGFFPESLRAELHEVRNTLEAYANRATIAGKDEATACGIDISGGTSWSGTLRVTSRGLRQTYRIDRWD